MGGTCDKFFFFSTDHFSVVHRLEACLRLSPALIQQRRFLRLCMEVSTATLSLRQSVRCFYRCGSTKTRGVSANFSSAAGSGTESQARSPSKLEIRSILHSSSQLFSPGAPLASAEWLRRTETAASRLTESVQRRDAEPRLVRVGVVGEVHSGTQELVEALLDDPMLQYGQDEQSDAMSKALIERRRRRSGLPDPRISYIRYGERSSGDSEGVVRVPSTWLQKNAIEVVEIVDPREGPQVASLLYSCDRLIFILDELTVAAFARFGTDLKKSKTVRLLQRFVSKPGTHVVINQQGHASIDGVELERGLQHALGEQSYEGFVRQRIDDRSLTSPLVRTSIELGLRANTALRSALREAGPTSPSASAWDHFSSLYAASGLSSVREAVSGSRTSGAIDRLKVMSSLFTLHRALEQASTSLDRDLEHAKRAFEAAEALIREVESERESAVNATFSQPQPVSGPSTAIHKRAGDRSKSIEAANKDAWNVVENTFAARLPWWKLLWKVDDVRAETEAAIARGFAKQLEQQLILQTGRLYSVAERLHRNVRSLFTDLDGKQDRQANIEDVSSTSPRNPFNSPVLLNELRKYPLEKIEAELKDDVLLQPIKVRREQLLASGGPVDLLCRRAQKNTVTSISTVGISGLASLSAGMAGSATFGSAFPVILQTASLQPSTAAASFAFATLATLWLTQTRWTRAKKRFWRDWQRLSDGMDNDLHKEFCATFDRIIAVQNMVASHGLHEKAAKYVREIEEAHSTIDAILAKIRQETEEGKR